MKKTTISRKPGNGNSREYHLYCELYPGSWRNFPYQSAPVCLLNTLKDHLNITDNSWGESFTVSYDRLMEDNVNLYFFPVTRYLGKFEIYSYGSDSIEFSFGTLVNPKNQIIDALMKPFDLASWMTFISILLVLTVILRIRRFMKNSGQKLFASQLVL